MSENPKTVSARELLEQLLHFKGVNPDLAVKALDVIFWLGGAVVTVIGVPMSVFRELYVVEAPNYFVPLALIVVSLAMFQRRLIPQELRPVVLVVLTLAGSVFMVARNGTLTAGGFPLLIALSAVFVFSGFRVTVGLVAAYSLAVIALLVGRPDFDFYQSFLGYGVNLSSIALLLGAVFVLHLRGEDLRSANEQTQQALRRSREDDFREIALMTQELRAPATAIYSLSQYKKLTPNMKADIMLSVERLEKLAFEIVAEAHGDLPILHRNQNLLNLLFDVSQQMHPFMTGRNITFSLDHGVAVERDYGIDSLRVRGILLNLCRAALFLDNVRSVHGLMDVADAPEQGPVLSITLTLNTAQQTASELIASWNSKSSETITHIALAQRELVQGKRWANHAGGSLDISSSRADNLVFRFTVPLEQPQVAYIDDGSALEISKLLVGKRVLVVDDDSLTRNATSTLLSKKFGAEVQQAPNLGVVQKLIESSEPYDLIMTDFMMPGGTGLDLIQQLPANKHPRWLVVVTASALNSDVNSLLAKGADLVLPKPLTADSVAIALMELVSREDTAGDSE